MIDEDRITAIDNAESTLGPNLGPLPVPVDVQSDWYRDLNRVTLIGCVWRHPTLVFVDTADGKLPRCSLWIRSRDSVKRPGGHIWQVEQFHCVKSWRGLAEKCGTDLAPGDPIYVEGRLSYEKWRNKEGNDVEQTCVAASMIRFLTDAPFRRKKEREEKANAVTANG